jgi:D-amino-acid dehydrogenase
MQVAVIGGGVVGVCAAYFLARAGHEVVVIERRSNVAEEASFGNAGIIAPACATPWAAPGMPRRILSHLFNSEAPIRFKPTLDPALWRWVRIWLSECEIERYRINKERMQRLSAYSRTTLADLLHEYPIDYEQTFGYLQLFRSANDLKQVQPALDLLAENGVPHKMLDADGARAIEPALSPATPLAGALHLEHDEAGNCPLFTKQMKQIAQNLGVQFRFASAVRAVQPEGTGVALHLTEDGLDKTFAADAVVLAAGIDSAALLAPLGIDVPLFPVKGYSATAPIKNYDEAPLAALTDESYLTSITRMGSRVRISGTAEIGSRTLELREAALRTLVKVGNDWFPNAANYSKALFWCGTRPMLPDGPPLLGATPHRNIYLNIGHGSSGWAMAAGSGKILADIVSGRPPEIDMDGLTLMRYLA